MLYKGRLAFDIKQYIIYVYAAIFLHTKHVSLYHHMYRLVASCMTPCCLISTQYYSEMNIIYVAMFPTGQCTLYRYNYTMRTHLHIQTLKKISLSHANVLCAYSTILYCFMHFKFKLKVSKMFAWLKVKIYLIFNQNINFNPCHT